MKHNWFCLNYPIIPDVVGKGEKYDKSIPTFNISVFIGTRLSGLAIACVFGSGGPWRFLFSICATITSYAAALQVDCVWNVMAHTQKPDFVFRRNGRVHLNRRGASVQSTTGSRGVRISGSNAGYTMFRGSVKSTGYPFHSPFPLHFPPPVRHRVPPHINWSLHTADCLWRPSRCVTL